MSEIRELFYAAYEAASGSPDPSNQNGAVLMSQEGVVAAIGCNCFADFISTDLSKFLVIDRESKLMYIEHAERATLFKASRLISMYNTTLICPWAACIDCARAIYGVGVKSVWVHKERMDTTPERWRTSVNAGLDFLQKGGVKVNWWSGEIGAPSILVNGERWYP